MLHIYVYTRTEGITKKVVDVLTGAGIEVILFEDVKANPTFTAVQEGISRLGDNLSDTVVGQFLLFACE